VTVKPVLLVPFQLFSPKENGTRCHSEAAVAAEESAFLFSI
jgi:hypothetical protein